MVGCNEGSIQQLNARHFAVPAQVLVVIFVPANAPMRMATSQGPVFFFLMKT